MTIKLELSENETSFILEALLARSLNRADGKGITSEILQKIEEARKDQSAHYCDDCVYAVQNQKIDSNGNCVWITTDCLADQNLTKENKSCKNMKI